jgi:hypothetical protein
LEVEGGLYHVITRGNDRQDIFHSDEDHRKFLSLLAARKQQTSIRGSGIVSPGRLKILAQFLAGEDGTHQFDRTGPVE